MKRTAPAAERNRGPILEVLRRVLPPRGLVLEIASGTGQHVTFFAAALPHLTWQPSDPDPDARASVSAWRAEAGLPNVRPPLDLDAAAPEWPAAAADALLNINMVHISPWAASRGLFAGAGRLLPSGAPLVLYGPFAFGGHHTAPSNAAFDRSLRVQEPRWGVRDADDLQALAEAAGLTLDEVVSMPANNHVLVFRKA